MASNENETAIIIIKRTLKSEERRDKYVVGKRHIKIKCLSWVGEPQYKQKWFQIERFLSVWNWLMRILAQYPTDHYRRSCLILGGYYPNLTPLRMIVKLYTCQCTQLITGFPPPSSSYKSHLCIGIMFESHLQWKPKAIAKQTQGYGGESEIGCGKV